MAGAVASAFNCDSGSVELWKNTGGPPAAIGWQFDHIRGSHSRCCERRRQGHLSACIGIRRGSRRAASWNSP
jgi:hypothetical protein